VLLQWPKEVLSMAMKGERELEVPQLADPATGLQIADHFTGPIMP
jgi:hypothetical protein